MAGRGRPLAKKFLHFPPKKLSPSLGRGIIKNGSPWFDRPENNSYQTFSEVIPWYFRYYGKTRILCRGEKPDLIPQNEVPTQREWRKYEFLLNKKNVILEGYAYLKFIENSVMGTYVDAARIFGTYPERVRQKVRLIKKLPKEILGK